MTSQKSGHLLAWVGVIAAGWLAQSAMGGALTSAAANRIVNESEHKPPISAAPPAVPNPDCTLIVPLEPLSAAGLATPYRLTATDPAKGPCHEANAAQSAFVQAAVFDPATGAIAIYNPLVSDRGSEPAAAPVVPVVPAGAIVAIWFGYDGTNLTLEAEAGSRLWDSRCVNGVPGSVFTQYAYCNAAAFFEAANAAIRSGQLHVPPLGLASDGGRCPSTRDFLIVDQDQSDNLPTQYLARASGRTAQDTAANRALLPQATVLGNPSDNRLLDIFVDAALGCGAWTAPDLADPGQSVPALALNELQARVHQRTPVALVPLGDPMTEITGVDSLLKMNLYRLGVDQPIANGAGEADTGRYCRQILRIAPVRLTLNEGVFSAAESPDPAAADSLYTFLAQRLVTTYDLLNCQTLIDQADPIAVVSNANGVVVSAAIDQAALQAILTALEPWKAQDDIADSPSHSR
jgi:hypothetical protein